MKEIIKFLNSESNIECSICSYTGDRIRVDFTDKIPDENSIKLGFYLLNEHNYYIQGDYSDYKYIYLYDEANKFVVFTTKEDDIYIEPETPTTPPSHDLTEEEKAAIALEEFNTAKMNKIKEMSNACEKAIENGVIINGKNYAYTLQDQSNMNSVMTIAKETQMDVPYHADGESCSLYSYEQISAIYIAEQMNLTSQQTYFNQLKLYINSLTNVADKDTVDAIFYGTELTGEYLENYNTVIAQSNLIMQTLVGGQS